MGSGSVRRTPAAAPTASVATPRAARIPGWRWIAWCTFLLLLAATWNKWMEPFVDTGRELMVPQRVSQGERLYGDVEFFHGPLGPWLGALVEKVAPHSLLARSALALVVAAAAVEALRRIALRSVGVVYGPLAAAFAVALPFFLRPGGWLCPFSLDTAIATAALLGVLAVEADAVVAALLLVALVCRLEMGLVAVVAAAVDRRTNPRRLGLVAGAPLAAAAAVYATTSAGIPYETLVKHGWLAIVRPPQAFQNVYRAFAGLDRPMLRLGEMALAGFLVMLAVGLIALAAAVTHRLRPESHGRWIISLLLQLTTAAATLAFAFPPEAWRETLGLFPPAVRLVPPICLLLLLFRVAAFARGRPPSDPSASTAAISDGALILAAMFSARVLLAAGYVGPYNAYFLPLPILIAVALALRGAQRWARPLGAALPGLVVASLAGFLEGSLLLTIVRYRTGDWERLDTPAGAVVLPGVEARTARPALADLARHLRPGSTLTGFPEAGFFNYVLSMKNPLPLDQFWPGHLDAAGEGEIVRLLESRPPDVVLRINALAVGEGTRAFGRDYSKILGASIERDFRPVAIYGPNAHAGAEIGDADFFVEIRVPARPAGPNGAPRP